jgi:hypothetical protein
MPTGLNEQQLQRIDDIVATRRKIKRGSTLFRNGEDSLRSMPSAPASSRPAWPPKMAATR